MSSAYAWLLITVVVGGPPDDLWSSTSIDTRFNSSEETEFVDEEELCECEPSPRPVVAPRRLEEEDKEPLPLYLSIPLILALLCGSAVFSGLNLGLMKLDMIALEAVYNGDNPKLARAAKRIMPLRKHGNLLLVTLLLGNVMVNTGLSILTAEIDFLGGLLGFIVSTGLIVLFGEVFPQATFAKYALVTGSFMVPFVKMVIMLVFPLALPLSKCLDWLLGSDAGTIYTTSELHAMVKIQIAKGSAEETEGFGATQLVEGAINFRSKKVYEIMTPLEDAYMLWYERVLDFDLVREIFKTGFSRIPVYGDDIHDFRGLLYTKDLIFADPEDQMRLGDFIEIFDRHAVNLHSETTLVEALETFKQGQGHLAVVRECEALDADPHPLKMHYEILGVVSLEDIVEEILQAEIVDEVDVYLDVDNRVQVGDGRESRKLNYRLFDPHYDYIENALTQDEVEAIANHLHVNVFSEDDKRLGMVATQWLVCNSRIVDRTRVTSEFTGEAEIEDYLYQAGVPTDECRLLLEGRVSVSVGRDGFRSEVGAFKILAKDALFEPYYRPDFSASVASEQCRYLVIHRDKYAEALHLSGGFSSELPMTGNKSSTRKRSVKELRAGVG